MVPRSLSGPARVVAGSPAIIPATLAVAVLIEFGASEGGFLPTTWYPGALFVLGVLVVAAAAIPLRDRRPSLALGATGLLLAYALWSLLSIAWAGQRAEAWDGANRALLYTMLFALFALWPIRGDAARVLLGVLAAGIVGLGVVELLRAGAAGGTGYLINGRLMEPVGYQNANAALWTCGLWPCVVLGSRRTVHPLLRGLFLGGAVVLVELAVLAQSRGWLFTLPIAAVLLLVLVPARLRTALALAAVAGGVVWALGPVLDVYSGYVAGRGVGPLLDQATSATLIAAAVVGLVGALAAVAEGTIPERTRRRYQLDRVRRIGAVVAAIVAVAALVSAASVVALAPGPRSTVARAWASFKHAPPPETSGRPSRFTGTLGTNRYDFWRVAVGLFGEHPVRGIGSGNFQPEYLRRGHSEERPRYPHSFELGVLSQTGIVGGLLLGAAIALALVAAIRGSFRGSRTGAAVAAAATATFLYWLLHASVDWFWEFPAVTGIAFAMLGLAVGQGARRRELPASGTAAPEVAGPAVVSSPAPAPGSTRASGAHAPARRRARARPRRGRVLALSGAVVAAGAAAVSLGLPWLSARETQVAIARWRAAPASAVHRLDRAAALDPLSSTPVLATAAIGLALGDTDVAERGFRAARVREPRDAYASVMLGAIASQRGQRQAAERLLSEAVRAAPQDLLASQALARVRRGRRLDARALSEDYAARARARAP